MEIDHPVLQNLQQQLDTFGIHQRLQALAALTNRARKTKNAKQHAAYERARYHNNPEYKQKHNQKTTAHIIHKYATDPEWRAKVREQQKEYYYRRKAANKIRQQGSSSPENI